MADLRMHCRDHKEIDVAYTSEGFSIGKSTALIGKMDENLAETEGLSDRFTELNRGFLYYAEIEEQNKLRILPIQMLYSRLAKLK